MATTSTASPSNGEENHGAESHDLAAKRSSTRSAVKGEASPRLPHEHDESSDSATRPPDPKMKQAKQDLDKGLVNTDRGEATDELYARTLRGHGEVRK